jgi:cell division protein FtsL
MRVNLLLVAALLVSSLMLVHTAYESRRLFAALDRERVRAQALEIEQQRLQAERQAQATPKRVEQVARLRLGMRTATPAVTEYVVDGARPAAAASAAVGAPR